MIDFKDKTIWIVGASSGIGEAMVYELIKAGAKIILSARRVKKLITVKNNSRYPENCTIIELDITNQESIVNAIKHIKKLPILDLVVLDAGIAQKGLAAVNPIEIDRKIMETNYFGIIQLTKLVLPIFINQKQGWFGVVTSLSGIVGVPGRSSYAASKHALHGFFNSLRAEIYEGCKINVSIIMPGFINTHITVKELKSDGSSYGKMEKAHQLGMSSETCAKKIVKGLKKQKAYIIVGGMEILGIYCYRFTPTIYDYLIRKHPIRKWQKFKQSIGLN